jgi:hypothetical protein
MHPGSYIWKVPLHRHKNTLLSFCQQGGITLEKEKGFQNGMLQDPHAPLKSNFASVSEMVNKDAGSLSRTSAESLSVILSPRDFEGEL